MSDRSAMVSQGAGETSATRLGTARPRLGFLGVGWIGRHRMEAVAASGVADIVAIADPSAETRAAAAEAAPGVHQAGSPEALLDLPLDGIVIASPSALHAEQSVSAMERGVAVFCQKPLGRTSAEVAAVVDSARRYNLLLGVDFSYRFAAAFMALRDLVRSGEIGDVYAVDLVFHNAYGPDKPWFYDPALAGGGCVMDLGIHLVDLAYWILKPGEPTSVTSRMFAGGQPLTGSDRVEDFATARIDLASGATVQLACSWNLSAGQDAVIGATFYGTAGAASVRNVDGSFYDFVAERFRGTQRERLVDPPDAWGGRAAVAWATELAAGKGFDTEVGEELMAVAEVVDRIYGRGRDG